MIIFVHSLDELFQIEFMRFLTLSRAKNSIFMYFYSFSIFLPLHCSFFIVRFAIKILEVNKYQLCILKTENVSKVYYLSEILIFVEIRQIVKLD